MAHISRLTFPWPELIHLKGIIKFWNMPSYLHGSIEVRSRIIFYFIHTYRILPFYVWKIDLNIQRGRAKLSKEDRHGYKHSNIKTLVATKKKSKFCQDIYIKYLFLRIPMKKKWYASTQFSEMLLKNPSLI